MLPRMVLTRLLNRQALQYQPKTCRELYVDIAGLIGFGIKPTSEMPLYICMEVRLPQDDRGDPIYLGWKENNINFGRGS